MANFFDKACRVAARRGGGKFVIWALGMRPGSLRFVGWLPADRTKFPGEPARTCDTVAHLTNPAKNDEPWAVVIEFQADATRAMFGRMGGYLLSLWGDQRPTENAGDHFNVGGVVINLRGNVSCSLSMGLPDAGIETTLLFRERHLQFEDAGATLGEIEAGTAPRSVLAFVPLMQGGDDPGIIVRWRAAAETEPNPIRRRDLGALAVVLAEAAGRRELWERELEGWGVNESQVVKGWMREATEKATREGKAEGKAEGQAESVARVLGARFGALPPEVDRAVRAVTDVGRLGDMLTAAVTAATLDDFLREAGL